LTVVLHEPDHALGDHHKDEGVMDERLPLGFRHVWNEWFQDGEVGSDPEFGDPGLSPIEVDDYFAMT
jgi:hypothetical protein